MAEHIVRSACQGCYCECIRQKPVEPVGECRDEKCIAIELGKRLGVLGKIQGQPSNPKGLLDFRLAYMGLTCDEFGRLRWSTTERIEQGKLCPPMSRTA
jgi:hypothetical protein